MPLLLIATVILWPLDAALSRDSVPRPPDLLLEQFGGIGDGRTDNLPAFASAIAALGTKGNGTIQDGGCIILGRGTYVITGSIDLTGKHGACIRGQGSLATVIKGVGDYPLIKDEGTFRSPTNKLLIRDIWFQCSGRESPNAHGIKLRYTNTGLVENSFFTGCNHGIHTQGAWQVRLVLNHWGGAGPQQNSICLFMDEPAADDPEHNNAVIATNNICENPARYGLRWLSAQGSIFTGNQWMKGIIGIYGCDPGRATFADGKPFDCQFVFFSGDQADSTTAQGWLFKRGVASVLGAGITMVNVWSGNTFMAGIEIDGADGLQIVGADVQSGDTGVNLLSSTNIRLDGQIRGYNRRNNGSAAVALDGTTNSSVRVTTKAMQPVGYNGIVERNTYSGNSIYGDWAICALGLTFGGSSSGLRSEITNCKYQISGMTVRMQTYFKLGAKGTATGPGAITGLPVPAALGGTGASVLIGAEGMRGLSGSIIAIAKSGTDFADLYLQKESGVTPITDANFTNNSVILGQIEYFKR